MAYWITPMENQQLHAINYPGDGFQEPLCLEYYSAFQDWQPSKEVSTKEFSFTPSPNPSFDLDLRALSGSEPPSETTTLPNSISDDSELSPPKIERVLHITIFLTPLDRRHLSTWAVLTHFSDEPRIVQHKKPIGNARRVILVSWNWSCKSSVRSITSCVHMFGELSR
jgi:hypothetical protein